jgi:hypothetical protein
MRLNRFALAVAMLVPAAYAQEMREFPVYRVDFTLHDSTDAAAKNGRKYSMLVNAGTKGNMRVGNRVPYATGVTNGSTQSNTQFQYFDVGVNIDCTVNERGGKYMMKADLDLSTLVPPDKSTGVALPNPTVSQIRINIDTTLAPGKATSVASFDDPTSSRKFDVDVTLTRL